MPTTETRLLLLRHGEVASHRGDVPVTEAGLKHAERSGKAIGQALTGPIAVMFGGTRRTRETAEAVVRGIGDESRIDGPTDSFALRNPDMYVAGTRVNMVSSPATLAEQVPGMNQEQAAANPWWSHFFSAPDRIGWWLQQQDPPGEAAAELATRILRFARSMADPGPLRGRTVIGVTHSPVLRAVLLDGGRGDPGELAYVTGADVRIGADGTIQITNHDPLGSDPPTEKGS
jgi:broad specificity phosphatase PhoE